MRIKVAVGASIIDGAPCVCQMGESLGDIRGH